MAGIRWTPQGVRAEERQGEAGGRGRQHGCGAAERRNRREDWSAPRSRTKGGHTVRPDAKATHRVHELSASPNPRARARRGWEEPCQVDLLPRSHRDGGGHCDASAARDGSRTDTCRRLAQCGHCQSLPAGTHRHEREPDANPRTSRSKRQCTPGPFGPRHAPLIAGSRHQPCQYQGERGASRGPREEASVPRRRHEPSLYLKWRAPRGAESGLGFFCGSCSERGCRQRREDDAARRVMLRAGVTLRTPVVPKSFGDGLPSRA